MQQLTVLLTARQVERVAAKIKAVDSKEKAIAAEKANPALRAVRWEKESRFAYGVLDRGEMGKLFDGRGI